MDLKSRIRISSPFTISLYLFIVCTALILSASFVVSDSSPFLLNASVGQAVLDYSVLLSRRMIRISIPIFIRTLTPSIYLRCRTPSVVIHPFLFATSSHITTGVLNCIYITLVFLFVFSQTKTTDTKPCHFVPQRFQLLSPVPCFRSISHARLSFPSSFVFLLFSVLLSPSFWFPLLCSFFLLLFIYIYPEYLISIMP